MFATIIRGRALGLPVAAVLLAGTLAACAADPPPTGKGRNGGTVPANPTGPAKATVRWDLSDGHSVKQVKWRGGSSFEVGGGVRVKLALPGRTFEDRVDRFGANRQGDQISDIVMYYPGASAADAYERAKRLAATWHVDTRNLDAWNAKVKARPGRPADLPHALANAKDLKPTGPGGPIPTIEISYSFDEKRPAMVKLQFFWRP